jgi:Abnormal spindle-like microcephaly-assoc'd, ASPM-SPD-2-Hydin
VNEVRDFGWEYVWHCHILSHEEMDMMRPIILNVATAAPAAPAVTATPGTSGTRLVWTDATPVNYVTRAGFGKPAAEIGYEIERAGGAAGTFTLIARALANATSFVDATALRDVYYRYRVTSWNDAGRTSSAIVEVNTEWKVPPASTYAPTSLSFGEQKVGVPSAPKTIKLSNSGASALVIEGMAIQGVRASDFAQTNDCGGRVAAHGSCTITVTFTALGLGSRTASLWVSTNDPGNPNAEIPLSGSATAATATVLPASLTFADQRVATDSPPKSVTVTNPGTSTLGISAITLGGTNAADYRFQTTCAATLAPSASCRIDVTFRPTAIGQRRAAITIASDDPAHPALAVPLLGTGAAPVVNVSPLAVAFPAQRAGTTSAATTVTVSNTGTVALGFNSISFSGANAGDFTKTTTCGTTLAYGSTCTVSVKFAPTAGGARSAGLVVDTDAGVRTVNLTGTGTAPAASVSPASFTFPDQRVGTQSAAKDFVISNTGTADLTVSGFSIAGADAADFAAPTSTCTAPVAPGASCTAYVTFRPSVVGPRSAELVVSSDAAQVKVPVSGTGIVPTATIAPASLAFPDQRVGTASAAQQVTISNTGALPVAVRSVTIAGANAGDFPRTSTCGATLAVGASCTIDVTFRPAATGARSAALAVDTDAAQTTVALAGIGVAPVAVIAPASLAFGNQQVGTSSAAKQVTVTNTGTAPLGITGVSVGGANAADFMLTNGCGASLAVGASCAVGVVFRPGAPGGRAGSLEIASDDPSKAITSATLTGTAVAVTLDPDPQSPSPHLNTAAVTFKATAAGSTGYSYQFWLWVGNTKTLVKDWSESATWSMPVGQAPGTYALQVLVRTSAAVAFDATSYLRYVVIDAVPATGVTLAVDPPATSPHLNTTPATFRAAATGSSQYTFQFWLWIGSSKTMVRDWDASNTWEMPSGQPAATYAVQVLVRTSNAVAFDATAYLRTVVIDAIPATAVTLTVDPATPSPHANATPATFTAAGFGSAGYSYQFWLWVGNTRTVVRDWSAGDAWTMPAQQAPGTYAVQVLVRTSSSVPYDVTAYLPYVVTR